MKIAVSGKGGVGKTTITSLLATEAAHSGHKVLAIDADPDANLASHLGFEKGKVKPLVELKDLIEERTGRGGLIKLNAKVDDIPDRFSVAKDGVKLLEMGTITRGGSGCACPANSFLKSLLSHVLLERDELVLVDMEAGIEHLGRGTAQGVDALMVVINADKRSLETKDKIKHLAADIGIEKFYTVGNKIHGPADKEMILKHLDYPPIGFINYRDEVRIASREGLPLEDKEVNREVANILKKLREEVGE